MIKRDDVESLLFPYKHFYNQQLVPTNLRNIWREGLCPDLISSLDSDLKERIPGVRRDAPAWLTQHLTAEQSSAELGWLGWKDDGWCVPGPGPHCSGDLPCTLRPGLAHEYMSVEFRTSEWGHAALLTCFVNLQVVTDNLWTVRKNIRSDWIYHRNYSRDNKIN